MKMLIQDQFLNQLFYEIEKGQFLFQTKCSGHKAESLFGKINKLCPSFRKFGLSLFQ